MTTKEWNRRPSLHHKVVPAILRNYPERTTLEQPEVHDHTAAFLAPAAMDSKVDDGVLGLGTTFQIAWQTIDRFDLLQCSSITIFRVNNSTALRPAKQQAS
jgi:hypothetical protein